jgi:hypothetical protein
MKKMAYIAHQIVLHNVWKAAVNAAIVLHEDNLSVIGKGSDAERSKERVRRGCNPDLRYAIPNTSGSKRCQLNKRGHRLPLSYRHSCRPHQPNHNTALP